MPGEEAQWRKDMLEAVRRLAPREAPVDDAMFRNPLPIGAYFRLTWREGIVGRWHQAQVERDGWTYCRCDTSNNSGKPNGITRTDNPFIDGERCRYV